MQSKNECLPSPVSECVYVYVQEKEREREMKGERERKRENELIGLYFSKFVTDDF